jgi:hypothetical protein
MTAGSRGPIVVEWSARASLSETMKALRSERSVVLLVEGKTARLLERSKRFLDAREALGWKDLWTMMRPLRFHTAYFYAESGGRIALVKTDEGRLVVEFRHESKGG